MKTVQGTTAFATCSVQMKQKSASNNDSDIQSPIYRTDDARPKMAEMQVEDVTAHEVRQPQGSGM